MNIPGFLQDGAKYATAWLAKNPRGSGNLAIWGCWEDPTLGAISALKQQGRTDVKTYGINGSPQAIKAVQNGSLTSTVWEDGEKEGRTMFTTTLKSVGGTMPSKATTVDVPGVLVSTDTVKAFVAEHPRCPSADPGSPLVRVRELSKHFGGVQALSGVDLDLWAGEVHGLVGANGAGKSTLIRCLAGLQAPDGGTIEVDGEPVTVGSAQDADRLGLCFIHQELNLVPHFDATANMLLDGPSRPGSGSWTGAPRASPSRPPRSDSASPSRSTGGWTS